MNELALFAGAGSGILGTQLLGFSPVCAVEIEPYAREVLLRRQEDGCFKPFPIWDDIRTFDGKTWRGKVDVITGGFPCQPFSVAGKQQAEDDFRNMWPDTIRVIREVGPRFCLLENVPGLLIQPYFGTILGELSEAGYDANWEVISAAECGANHLRERVWIFAYSNSRGFKERKECNGESDSSGEAQQRNNALRFRNDVADTNSRFSVPKEGEISTGRGAVKSCSEDVSDTMCHRSSARVSGSESRKEGNTGITDDGCGQRAGWWEVEPNVGRVVDGLPFRTHRLRAIGNAQVPAVVVEAWERLTEGIL